MKKEIAKKPNNVIVDNDLFDSNEELDLNINVDSTEYEDYTIDCTEYFGWYEQHCKIHPSPFENIHDDNKQYTKIA